MHHVLFSRSLAYGVYCCLARPHHWRDTRTSGGIVVKCGIAGKKTNGCFYTHICLSIALLLRRSTRIRWAQWLQRLGGGHSRRADRGKCWSTGRGGTGLGGRSGGVRVLARVHVRVAVVVDKLHLGAQALNNQLRTLATCYKGGEKGSMNSLRPRETWRPSRPGEARRRPPPRPHRPSS